MKILLIHDYGTPTGGAELQFLSWKQDLIAQGHDVRLFSSNTITYEGSQVESDYQCFGTNSRLQVVSQVTNLSAYYELKRVLSQFQPDVVHIRMFLWQLSPLILPLLKPYPTLYQAALYKSICPNGTKILPDGKICQFQPGKACLQEGCLTPQTWVMLMLQQKLWNQWRDAIDLVVALSHKMKSVLEENGVESVEVVYNSIEPRQPRPPLGQSPIIGYAGRISPEKGIEVVFQALAKVANQIPSVKLIIAGEGKEESKLRQLADRLAISDHIKWLGHLSRDEMEKHFDRVWVQVVPSSWDEPFGNVTTEAMMRGTAVLASNMGAQPEIVDDGVTGLLVSPHDVDGWCQALLQLLENRELAETMGQKGHQLATAKFSVQKRYDRFLEIYQRLISKYQKQNLFKSNTQDKKNQTN